MALTGCYPWSCSFLHCCGLPGPVLTPSSRAGTTGQPLDLCISFAHVKNDFHCLSAKQMHAGSGTSAGRIQLHSTESLRSKQPVQRRDSGRLGQKWLPSGLPSRAYGQFSPLVDPVVDCVSLGNGLGGVRSAAWPFLVSHLCQWVTSWLQEI